MASLETAIRTILLDDPDVADIVGSNVRPMNLAEYDPEDEATHPPHVLYTLSKDGTFDSLDVGPMDYRPGELTVESVAVTYGDCADLSDAVQTLLAGYGGTVEGVEIDFDFRTESDIEEATIDGTDETVWVRSSTYGILYRRT